MNPVCFVGLPAPARHGFVAACRLLALAGVLLAGGCAPSRDYSATESCAPERLADIPITMLRNVPVATVTINGKPARMVVDSGADRSLLTPAAAARLGVRGDPLRSVMSRGIGGSDVNAGFIADTLDAGGLTLDGPTFGLAVTRWSLAGDPPDGFIGSALLSRFEVDLDFADGHLGLYRARTCPTAEPAWDGAHRTVPLTRAASDHDLYVVPVRLDAATVAAIVDTGAEFTALSPATAAQLGVSGPAGGSDRALKVNGIGAKTVDAFVHVFTSLTVAGQTTRAPRLAVVDLPAPALMLLGTDYWRHHRVWLAYAAGRMFVRRDR